MIQRSLAIALLLFLAACGNSASPSPEASAEPVAEATIEANEETVAEATPEATALTEYNFPLTKRHHTTLNWGGTATYGYPENWVVRDTSLDGARGEITIYGVDNYSFSLSLSNDPSNTENTVQSLLNRLNQSAPIETVEREGRMIYYTLTRGGNAWAAAAYIEGTAYAFVEMVNTSRLPFEPMQETAFTILLSIEITPEE